MTTHLIVVSEEADSLLKENLKKIGKVIELSPSSALYNGESCHPDMRICRISESHCVVSPDLDKNILDKFDESGISYEIGQTILTKKYPENIAYNVSVGDKIYFHNIEFTDGILSEKLEQFGKRAVNVKQGYSGCSSIFAGETLITSDMGIYKKALTEKLKTILFKNPESIILKGFDHGFIGGCCGFHEATGLLVNCANEYLPEDFIVELNKNNIRYSCIGEGKLTDIGGIIIFTGHF